MAFGIKIFDAGTYVFSKTFLVVGLDIHNIYYKQYDKVYPFQEEDGSVSMMMKDKQPVDPN